MLASDQAPEIDRSMSRQGTVSRHNMGSFRDLHLTKQAHLDSSSSVEPSFVKPSPTLPSWLEALLGVDDASEIFDDCNLARYSSMRGVVREASLLAYALDCVYDAR